MLHKTGHKDEKVPIIQRQHKILHGGLLGSRPVGLTKHAHGRMELPFHLNAGVQLPFDSNAHLDLHLAAVLHPSGLLQTKNLAGREIQR